MIEDFIPTPPRPIVVAAREAALDLLRSVDEPLDSETIHSAISDEPALVELLWPDVLQALSELARHGEIVRVFDGDEVLYRLKGAA